jgi:GDP-L-fucose synthase
MVGGALVRHFKASLPNQVLAPSSKELDLTVRSDVFDFIASNNPTNVVMAAAKVGGIIANSTLPYDFISVNLQIQSNLLDACLHYRVPRVLFLGSSCIYPRDAKQPITEDALLSGPLEETNKPYALAKLAGIVQVQAARAQHGLDWISAQPTNLYGIGDNYHRTHSHVIPGLIRRYHEAKVEGREKVTNWGSGNPTRDFLFSEDVAEALHFLLDNYHSEVPINIGSGAEISIREAANLISEVTGYEGVTEWDTDKPDGTPRKVLDTTRLSMLGWQPKTSFSEGLVLAFKDFLESDTRK